MECVEDFQMLFLQAQASYCRREKIESRMNPNYEGLKSEVKRSQNLIDAKIDPKSIWGDYLMMKCELEAELLEIKKKKKKNPQAKEIQA